MSSKAQFERLRPRIEAALDRLTPAADAPPQALHQSMRYSLFGGGKRLRPILVLLAHEAAGGTLAHAMGPADVAAAAVEMVHTYSLIHDDLPAMDDDDLRRGRSTCHKVYGEALAILAGDGLLTRAFEVLAREVADAGMACRLAAELGAAAGPGGMVGGQVLDVAAEGAAPAFERALDIVRRKTAALIAASVAMGGITAGASVDRIGQLRRYGERVGMAFQVADDLLDRLSTAEVLGKTPGKDVASGKLTLPAVLGLDAARRTAAAWIEEGKAELEGLAGAAPLRELADFVLDRRA
ncbi:MAG: polyprenyl synthetase family protein [Planctomycetes bacterium]|nr:polyprenyl synthetase family protein [Planctomycetota bacterium]